MSLLMKEAKEAGVECSYKSITGMLLADYFVGVSDLRESLLMWCMIKVMVMVFARNWKEGEWIWGEHRLPRVCSYRYLGIVFTCNGAWDVIVW